jgi:hypothetical protein
MKNAAESSLHNGGVAVAGGGVVNLMNSPPDTRKVIEKMYGAGGCSKRSEDADDALPLRL